ncbi:Imm7 family immunity protein [Solirubrobacter soli]|uniref:Imm7 family immunity protein n=1 Tax=Solirubrobacter soli TaxID=363832 RepID=UPI000404AC39|nr:Imm7 family immunity protein [Solirubrobacter soli]
MFEFHGWVTVRERPFGPPSATEVSDATLARVRALLETAPTDFVGGMGDLRRCNADWHVWLSGLRNHAQPWVTEVYAAIAELAPGSYGLLHIRDDEAPDGERWVCWTMLGGRVEASTEERLTPHLGRVEDGPPY